MATLPIGQAGIQGLRDNLDRAQSAANRIVQSTALGSPVEDISEAVVELKSAELGAKASVEVIETANRTAGTLIDVLV